jgi:hypothetical protein
VVDGNGSKNPQGTENGLLCVYYTVSHGGLTGCFLWLSLASGKSKCISLTTYQPADGEMRVLEDKRNPPKISPAHVYALRIHNNTDKKGNR